MNLYEKPANVQTHWISFENSRAERGCAGLENCGAKGHAFDHIKAGDSKTLLDVEGSGTITRIWLTIGERDPEMLRSLRLDMYWDGADGPAVSVPLGDFFGVGLGRRVAFECALFSDPEGRSFNCFVPMPFRKSARVTLTNESCNDLTRLFYDIDLLVGVDHSPQTLYFHAFWRRESPNELGEEFVILPRVEGNGRFLGCNIGVIADRVYNGAWWGEGEVKVRFGKDENPTLCGTGTEDYIGTGWGQGFFAHRTQGCHIADKESGQWCFYRYHIDDPIFFDDACMVSIQTIGGDDVAKVAELIQQGVAVIPISVDNDGAGNFTPLLCDSRGNRRASPAATELPKTGWCNFWRRDDWSATAYFYFDRPEGVMPPIAPARERLP